MRTAFISFFATISLLGACGGGGGGSERVPVVLSGVIGPEGGVLEELDPSSPLHGLSIVVPAGALAAPLELRVTEVLEPPPLHPSGVAAGPAVELGPPGTTFDLPVTLVLPYHDADHDGVVDGLEVDERELAVFSREQPGEPFVSALLVGRDPIENRLTAETTHFSLYQVTPWDRLTRGPVRVWFEPEGAEPHAFPPGFDYERARQTILDAIYAGSSPEATWKPLTDCLGWEFELTESSAEDANVEVRWRSFAQLGHPANAHAVTENYVHPLPSADCQAGAPRFRVTFNEDRAAEFHLSPSQDPIQGLDLFSATAHEFAHTVGLPPECDPDHPANCNITIPSTPHSVIDGFLEAGEDTRTLTPEDIDFFEERHAIEFRERAPLGCEAVPQPVAEISAVLRTICEQAELVPGTQRMRLTNDAGFSLDVPSAELTTSPQGAASEWTVAYSPPGELPPGTIRVELAAMDDRGRRASSWWSFLAMGPPPVAAFSGSPRNGPAPLTVAFQDQSTGEIATWSWDFGDGTSSSEPSPTHTYAAPGTYDVSLTVDGPFGADTLTRPGYVQVAAPQPGSLDCSSGVDLEVTELNGGDSLRIRWCTADEVIDQGGAFWTLQARGGGVCPWQNQFTAEERTFDAVVGNGLGSSYCLRVIVQPPPGPQGGGCETGILASDTDGNGCP